MKPLVAYRSKPGLPLVRCIPRRVTRRLRRIRDVYCVKRREDRFPYDKPIHEEVFKKSEGLHVSIFTPFKDLPPDGKVITDKDEKCDPLIQRCQTPTYVYETPCPLCKSTGTVESKSKGKRRLYTCISCHGLGNVALFDHSLWGDVGYVRRATSRFIPEVSEDGFGDHLTLRPELMNGYYKPKDKK